MKLGFEELEKQVVRRGLCTACGTCIGVCPTGCLAVGYEHDELVPVRQGECTACGICLKACPGSDIPLPDLERFVFGKEREATPRDLSVFITCKSGYAADKEIRQAGASGGVVTALLAFALDTGRIDCAIVAGFSKEKPWLAEAKIASTRQELIDAAQSKYQVVATNSVLNQVVKQGYKKIAVVGLPCHIHGIRKMQYLRLAPRVTKSIQFLIGLFCGSEFYFEATRHLISEWCHVADLNRIERLQYRGGGWPGDFILNLKDGQTLRVPRHVYSPRVMLRYPRDRCAMCIDWSSELADISVGDYWEAGSARGQLGKSSILVRTDIGNRLLNDAHGAKRVALDECSTDSLVGSGGFELKKHAAAFKLKQRQQCGWPTPDFHRTPDHSPVEVANHVAMPEK